MAAQPIPPRAGRPTPEQMRTGIGPGHTHGAMRYEAAPNVVVRVAAATYGRPRIADLISFGTPDTAYSLGG